MTELSFFVLPVLIFCARIADVSLGTLRITMVSRGYKWQSALLGFFEVLIWVIVVAQLLKNLNHWVNYVAYAAGFSAGTFIGLYIEDKMKVGTVLIRIITLDKSDELIEALKEAGVAITSVDAKGGFNDVKVIFTVLKRKKLNKVYDIVKEIDPEAFFSTEDVKYSNKHHDHLVNPNDRSPIDRLLRVRKGL
ncbi:MAG: DUF2179 domain-containing protein [Gracilimonas sp.]|uniref:DUF2179 domain-containing protein n=1 Tax=Gracilimonas TaxID=649462 RepID=UPI001B11302C|nr:DUF2179 domain-containing protein [Gracilimonas sp.]MBO6584500.1 DUF2179 domain-containing protein [Gracilimonas sp.]MBO6616229.1 DUF2179 domain-containing protein [Gracilimonas sp.]